MITKSGAETDGLVFGLGAEVLWSWFEDSFNVSSAYRRIVINVSLSELPQRPNCQYSGGHGQGQVTRRNRYHAGGKAS